MAFPWWIKNNRGLKFEILVILECMTSPTMKIIHQNDHGLLPLWCCSGNGKSPPIATTAIEMLFIIV
jgi:hypothetical protein